MATSGCFIQVHLGGSVSLSDVAGAVEAYWTSRGARVRARDYQPVPGRGVEASSELGYVIRAGERGWCTVIDSERNTADVGLAQHLAQSLRTCARHLELRGGAGQDAERRFGEAPPTAQVPLAPSGAYPDAAVEVKAGELCLVFDDVAQGQYQPGQEASLGVGLEERLVGIHREVVQPLDWEKGVALLKSTPARLRPRLLPVLLNADLDLSAPATCAFVLHLGREALGLAAPSAGQLVKISEAAARLADGGLLEQVKRVLRGPEAGAAPALLRIAARRVGQQDGEAGARLLALLEP